MRSPADRSRSAGVSGSALALLVTLTVALVAAFVVAPRMLAGRSDGGFADERHLIVAVREAFVAYWSSGHRELNPSMERVVGFWFRYHVAKALIAVTLLIILVALGVLLWKAFLWAGNLRMGGRALITSAGTLVTMLGLLSLVTVMANVQGAIAPFASLLPMLALGTTDRELAGTLDRVRQQLADSGGAGASTSPALQVMVNEFSRYHVALAVVAAIVAVVLMGTSVLLWRGVASAGSSDRRMRRVLVSYGVLSALMSLAVVAVAVANATTAADPTPALLAFFEGGW